MNFKKISKTILACSIALCTFTETSATYADSGVSTLPPKETALEKYTYSTYAPKTQTKYKKFETVIKKVSTIKKEADELIVVGTDIMAVGTFAGAVSGKKKFKILKGVAVVSASGAVIYGTGRIAKIKYKNIKDKAIVKSVVYFKWKNPKKFEYSTKIKSWIEYKGKRISEVKTYYYNRSL